MVFFPVLPYFLFMFSNRTPFQLELFITSGRIKTVTTKKEKESVVRVWLLDFTVRFFRSISVRMDLNLVFNFKSQARD